MLFSEGCCSLRLYLHGHWLGIHLNVATLKHNDFPILKIESQLSS